MKRKLKKLQRIIAQERSDFILRLFRDASRYGWHKYIRRRRYASQRIHEHIMLLDLHDPGISRALFMLRDREREHRYLLERTLSAHKRILDLGANIGYYVLLEDTLRDADAHITAVEPVHANFELLENNLQLNSVPRVKCLRAAVTNRDAPVSINLGHGSNVHSLLQRNNATRHTGRQERVPGYSLSTIAGQYGPFDFIRMDIEGYETRIFQTILDMNKERSYLPTILFELHRSMYNPGEMDALLENLYGIGYVVRHAASWKKHKITARGADIIRSVPTDGTVRYITGNLTLSQSQAILRHSRCAVLAARENPE